MLHPDYEMVIGLEVHAQITTATKLFSGTSTTFGAEPNTQVNQIDLGMPGVLPVLNTEAVDAGIKLGFALDFTINRRSVFDRKNYFYPDLPKGYQITQMGEPIVENGKMEIDLEDGSTKVIGITRMHLEEDAGKSVHDFGAENHSHVDLNRAGIPLMEIVSEPELSNAYEAGEYIKKLRAVLRFLEVCDGNMEQGSMRCDANVSVRKKGAKELGTRCEIKNLNSIRNVMRAIDHEADRQVDILEDGGIIDQETRLWDTVKNETRTMRSKEDAHDYRYFNDPDILPLNITEERIEACRLAMPELPDEMKARLMSEYELSAYDAGVLTLSKENAHFYEAVVGDKNDPKLCANWLTGELFGALNKMNRDLSESPVSPTQLGDLVAMISSDTISGKIAKQVFADMLETSRNPKEIVEEKGLVQITDTAAIEAVVDEVIAANADNVEKFRAGNERLIGFFVGQVMQKTGGKANPKAVNEVLRAKL